MWSKCKSDLTVLIASGLAGSVFMGKIDTIGRIYTHLQLPDFGRPKRNSLSGLYGYQRPVGRVPYLRLAVTYVQDLFSGIQSQRQGPGHLASKTGIFYLP